MKYGIDKVKIQQLGMDIGQVISNEEVLIIVSQAELCSAKKVSPLNI